MRFKRPIVILTLLIAFLAFAACLVGILTSPGSETYSFQSIHGQAVDVYGKGVYKNDSVSVVAQGVAQDYVTLFIGIPLLLFGLYYAVKGSLKGKLLLAGTLGYFLYTYISYTFLWNYNFLFLIYVFLMSASFYAFTLTLLSIDTSSICQAFDKKLPVKFLGGFQIFFSIMLGLLWLGKILPSISGDTAPAGLEHYTTLVIQGLDLGFIAPTAMISGILLMKRSNYGYLLTSVMLMKGFTMGAAISAMVLGQAMAGVSMSFAELLMFPLFSILFVICLVLLVKNIKTPIRN